MTAPNVPPPLDILVVDDETNIRKTLSIGLESDGHRVVAVSNANDAIAEAARHPFDFALVDLRLGTTDGLDLIPELLGQSPWMRIVVITAHGSIDSAVEAMRRGASDYLTKPFTPAQVKLAVDRAGRVRALEQQIVGLEDGPAGSESHVTLNSGSAEMQRAINLAREAAKSDATILLRGESGTGKGVLARAIHRWSPRAAKGFATISCPALSPELLESELFGHVRGAFTGAIRDNPGRIADADGGTLFLDEIGDLPLKLQPKLLRFLQEREYERVGESRTRRADVRVISATNVHLEEAVRGGRFREDLLYRVNVVQVDLPPLRDRSEDIVHLAERFLSELGREKSIVGFTVEALTALRNYHWPGNIRELRNVLERAVILSRGERIGVETLPKNFMSSPNHAAVEVGDAVSLNKLEESHIRRVLAKSKSLEDAASILGIDVATLWRRRKRYGI